MIKKLITVSLIIIFILSFFTGCVPAPAPVPAEKPASAASIEEDSPSESDSLDLDAAYTAIIDNFTFINSVPRFSGDTGRISQNILKWANDNGLDAQKDEIGNVVVDRPAAEGFEDYPKVILQAHMDYMRFAKEGVSDAVKPAADKNGVFTCEGASFGASDGFGVAEIMYIMTSEDFKCGPLRAIFTVDGDSGFSGAVGMDASLLDSNYLISFDGLQNGSVAYGHTGSRKRIFTKPVTWEENSHDLTYEITVRNLSGGDSGLYADTNSANAIRLLAECMDHVINDGISVSLSSFSGGENDQSIPTGATAVISLDSEKKQEFETSISAYAVLLDSAVRENEPSMSFEWTELTDNPSQVVTQDDSSGLLNLLILSIEGVNTMSATTEGVVESSCSISAVKLDSESITVDKYERGYSKGRFDQMENADITLANMSGFKVETAYEYPGFTNSADSEFLLLAVNTIESVFNEGTNLSMLNTSMEPGFFAEKKPDLDMIIIGESISGVHSALESCSTENSKLTIRFVYELLRNINTLGSPAA